MPSPYYVAPAGDIGGGLAGLGQVLQQATAQREERAAKEKMEQERRDGTAAMIAAYRDGDIAKIGEVAVQYPWLAEQAKMALGLNQDFQQQEAADFAIKVLSDPENAAMYADERLANLNAGQRDPMHTQGFRQQLDDPETRDEALFGLEAAFATTNNDAWKAWREINKPKEDDGFSLSRGQVRYDAQGNVIAENPEIAEPEEREVRTDANGVPRYVDDGTEVFPNAPQIDPTKTPTAAQSLASGYAQRTLNSNDILTRLGPEFTGIMSNAVGVVPQRLRSDERQQFDQATRDFINATLRRESGAAIAESEFENARLQYIPQPGDGEAVLEQKKRNRDTVQAALAAEAGPALDALRDKLPPSTVMIMGRPYTIGSEVVNSQGQRGRIEADGTITVLD